MTNRLAHRRRRSLALVAGGLIAALNPGLARADEPSVAEASPTGETRRFALVVGVNATRSAKQAPLRFADDDAARMAELLEEAGVDVTLLTSFDRDSQETYPDLVKRAEQPTPAGLKRAWKQLRARMAKVDGPTELVIYYSGHGDVGTDGKGFLTLEGGKLDRRDLFTELVGRSTADYNHLLIDACKSEELVLSRGGGWKPDRTHQDYSREVTDYLDRNQLAAHPNTGVILAASVDQQTHEWARYRGGVFTQQLISALRGGGDLNGDGRVEYSEIGAFVSAANSGVTDRRAKLGVVVRPPARDERAPVLVHDNVADQRVLLFAGGDRRHYVVEDRRGVRVADLRRAGGSPGYLRVPDGDLFLSRDAGKAGTREEAMVVAAAGGVTLVPRLAFKVAEQQPRGALDEALRDGLFTVGYGREYYLGYADQAGLLAVEDPEWEVRVWKKVDGEMVEVARIEGNEGEVEVEKTEAPATPEGPASPVEREVVVVETETTYGDDDWHWGRTWGGLSLGTEYTPFTPEGSIRLNPRRVVGNQFEGFGGSGYAQALRGFDARWWVFGARDAKDYPRWEGYFRTGYTQGSANFLPASDADGFQQDDPTKLEYFTVPLFFGGNVYAVRRFPIRPYAGFGAGFDILSVDYSRFQRSNFADVSLRIGFELHAGVDIRITNWFGVVGEVRQLWSARRRISGLPDYSNEGLTIVTGLRFNVPLSKKDARRRRKKTKVTTTTVERTRTPDPMPAPSDVPPPPAPMGESAEPFPAPKAPEAAPPPPPTIEVMPVAPPGAPAPGPEAPPR